MTLSRSLETLIACLPPDVVHTDPQTVETYRFDTSRDHPAGMPLAVALPHNVAEVQTIMRWAHENRVGVIPRGAGSGLAGGATAVDGTIMLSLARMRQVTIDAAAHVAIAEPGAFNAAVKTAAAEHGLWYPPDPSSFEICSIGGNIATNAGGLCCVKYGVTTDYVLGLDVVLADGTLITLGGTRVKDVAGLSLLKLFVGSEGTLGVITRAILRLVPAQPERATVVATFASVEDAANAVVGVGASLRPAMMELMDKATTNAVEDYFPIGMDRTAEAILIAQSDAPGMGRDAEIAAMSAVFSAQGATGVRVAADAVEGERFAAARRAVFPALESKGTLIYGDAGVSVPLLPQLVRGIEEISGRHGIFVALCAHAGDGNTHPSIVFDGADPDSERRARIVFDEIMTLAISLGGTITGEHGIGRVKKHALPAQLGDDVMALSRRIKDAVDPRGILNPGSMF